MKKPTIQAALYTAAVMVFSLLSIIMLATYDFQTFSKSGSMQYLEQEGEVYIDSNMLYYVDTNSPLSTKEISALKTLSSHYKILGAVPQIVKKEPKRKQYKPIKIKNNDKNRTNI